MTLNENNYVDKAKQVMDELFYQGRCSLTATKIRGLLAMTADIYNEVLPLTEDEMSDEIKGKINYLKVHFLYEVGKGKTRKDQYPVKCFIEKAHIIQYIEEIQGSRENYLLFSRYMEALVAYFKFKGGRD